MPKRTSDHHSWLLKQLTNPIVASNYLNAASSDSPDIFLVALRNVAEAHKMAKVAGEAGVAREALYRTLSEEGNPRFDTLGAILKAVGLRISVEAVGGPISPLGRSPYTYSRPGKRSRRVGVQLTGGVVAAASIGGTDQTDQVKSHPSYRPSGVRRIFGFLSKSTFQRSEDPALFQLQIEKKANWTTGRIRIGQPPAGAQFTQTPAVGTAFGNAILAGSKSPASETAQSRHTEIGSALSCAF